ncbi:MAG TPA: DNA repair protein RecO [Alphaproteobacteria bacterium]|nr:DNA repair protein RecO [Alphaproteobacteria bacterium]
MNWSEPAFILSFRAHGEWDAVVSVFSHGQGRYLGLVRGGQSSKHKNQWQPGHLAKVNWRARLFEHLGFFTGEAMRDYSAGILHLPLALSALSSACTLLDAATPERMALPDLFDAFQALLPLDEGEDDLARYVRFEAAVLKALGYGLDLSSCALTATTRDLCYISPKTGRAVNKDAAAPWAQRLLPLPEFLRDAKIIPALHDVFDGLQVTGHFLENHVFANLPAGALAAVKARRQRLIDLLEIKKVSGLRADEVAK